MNPEIRAAQPLENFRLLVKFANGERRIFDVSPYLSRGVFQRLRDVEVFKAVRVISGSLEWPGELDLSYDTVYLESTPAGGPPITTLAAAL